MHFSFSRRSNDGDWIPIAKAICKIIENITNHKKHTIMGKSRARSDAEKSWRSVMTSCSSEEVRSYTFSFSGHPYP